MLRLEIALKSGLCAGSGVGRPGFVDREVAFDRYGLPYLPGRSLKGLLRDAYRDLPAGLLPGLPPVDELFGETGAVSPGSIDVGTARLTDFGRLSGWLRTVYADPRLGRTIRRDDVIEHYSEIRRQTAMDRESGAPLKDTLRATRLIRPTLTLQATITSPFEHTTALALAAAGLKQMGTSRNRGPGEVDCSLWDESRNLTREAIEKLSQGTLEFAPREETQKQEPPISTAGTGQYVLGFSLELTEGAVFPAFGGDANTVLSERFVPGSAIRGMLAWQWIARYSDGPPFARLFLGAVRYLAAFVRTADNRRALPIPHSIRESKGTPNIYYDLSVAHAPEPTRRVGGWVQGASMAGSRLVEVESDLHYHHARAVDARVGRAVGEEDASNYKLKVEEAGSLFTYESLAPGNRFRGAILGTKEDLELLLPLVGSEPVRLGRSASAQYGGRAKWTWDTTFRQADLQSEAYEWTAEQMEEDVDSGDTFQLTVLSPLLSRTPEGHPAARLPLEELTEALGNAKLTLIKEFVRVRIQGGYLAHQRLPREQMPALEPGSVFLIKTDQLISRDLLNSASARSWGMRTEDGFGRIAIAATPQAAIPGISTAKKEPSTASPFNGDTFQAIRKLATDLFKKRVEERAVLKALEAARECENLEMSNHLLSRLAGIVAVTGLNELPKRLRELRHRAKGQLGTLEQILNNASGENWQEKYQEFVKAEMASAQQAGGEPRHWSVLFGQSGSVIEADESVVRNYLLRLLAGIARARRRSA
jgi:CRISPR-associated protein Csx10